MVYGGGINPGQEYFVNKSGEAAIGPATDSLPVIN